VACSRASAAASDDKRWKIVNGTMRKNGFARHALIETLHTVQSAFGYLDDDAIRFVALSLHVPLSRHMVSRRSTPFQLKPPGKHTMTVCTVPPATSRALQTGRIGRKTAWHPQGQTTKTATSAS